MGGFGMPAASAFDYWVAGTVANAVADEVRNRKLDTARSESPDSWTINDSLLAVADLQVKKNHPTYKGSDPLDAWNAPGIGDRDEGEHPEDRPWSAGRSGSG